MTQRTKKPPRTVEPPPELTPLRTAEEIEPIVGLKASTIRRKVKEGLFPCQRVGTKGGGGGGLIFFSDQDVAEIRAMTVKPERPISEIQP